MNSAGTSQDNWQAHVNKAVLNFLKTAVVIDNQPSISTNPYSAKLPEQSTGIDDIAEELEAPTQSADTSKVHDLNVRSITDAFINEGIACAFVLPDDDSTDDGPKIERALKASKVSDLVVIDWFLKDTDASLTLQILEQIARSDNEDKGRLRLVCIYTGQILNEQIFADILNSFRIGGIELQRSADEQYCACSQSTFVVLLNKGETSATELPLELIKYFTRLADGLVPSFALAAVGAVRKNVHHFVTRFSKTLDSAYIANRLITNPPGDVTELMRELLVAEFDNAIGMEKVADEYLDVSPIQSWIHKNTDIISTQANGAHPINSDFLLKLLGSCIEDKGFNDVNGQFIKLEDKKRELVSIAVSGSQEVSRASQDEFSRLVLFKREAYLLSRTDLGTGWRPSLTTGSLLRSDDNKYYVCFTPACDTLRLTTPSSFVFLEATIALDKYNVTLKDIDGHSVGLRFDRKRPTLSTFVFLPDDTQRVRAELQGENVFIFNTQNNSKQFIWLGELRYGRATSEMAQIVSNWMRIGINDSEYLRLIGTGKISLS